MFFFTGYNKKYYLSEMKMETKIKTVETLFEKYFSSSPLNDDRPGDDVALVTRTVAVAPGRVNLIGERKLFLCCIRRTFFLIALLLLLLLLLFYYY